MYEKETVINMENTLLSDKGITRLINDKAISCDKYDEPIQPEQIQASSLDLRCGKYGYQVLNVPPPSPFFNKGRVFNDNINPINLINGDVLEVGNIYVIPILEQFSLFNITGYVNTKSSLGRLGVSVRLYDGISNKYNYISPICKHDESIFPFLIVIPLSFSIKVKMGDCLCQAWFEKGYSRLPDDKVSWLNYNKYPLTYAQDGSLSNIELSDGLLINVSIPPHSSIAAYKAKLNNRPINLSLRNFYNPEEYWDDVYADTTKEGSFIVLEPNILYLVVSKQWVSIPLNTAAELIPYDYRLGDYKNNLAGFFDAGFGFGDEDGNIQGTPVLFEIKVHDVPMLLADNQVIGKLQYYDIKELPFVGYGVKRNSSYQFQQLTLSKQFKKNS